MKSVFTAGTARFLAAASACVALATLLGCGGDATKSSVSGKVTYKGAPVTGGSISVVGGKDLNIGISINADGTFMSKDVPPGEYKVAVSTDNVVAIVAPPSGKDYPVPEAGASPTKVVIPDKFKNAETSGITWSVKSGSQNLPIDLGQ